MKKRKLIVALTMAGCLMTACSGNSQTATTSEDANMTTSVEETTIEETTVEETTVEETAVETIPIGQTASLKTWNITITNMQMLDSVDNGFGSFLPEDGNKYMLVTATVENTGKESDTFLPSFGLNDDVSVKVLYGDGYEFSLTQLLGYERDLINSTLNPLSTKEGDMAFELPNTVVESTDSLVIEFSSGNESVQFALR